MHLNLIFNKIQGICLSVFEYGVYCLSLYRVIQEEASVFWEMMLSVIMGKTVDMNTCLILNCSLDRAV